MCGAGHRRVQTIFFFLGSTTDRYSERARRKRHWRRRFLEGPTRAGRDDRTTQQSATSSSEPRRTATLAACSGALGRLPSACREDVGKPGPLLSKLELWSLTRGCT